MVWWLTLRGSTCGSEIGDHILGYGISENGYVEVGTWLVPMFVKSRKESLDCNVGSRLGGKLDPNGNNYLSLDISHDYAVGEVLTC